MAIEWVVPAAVAVTKLLLRASGKADTADAIDDAQEGWARLRRSQRNPDIIGYAIADRLESRLADDNEAVLVAAAHPERFLNYAKQHGAENLRQWTPEAATPLFDQILEAAAMEFTTLAPHLAGLSELASPRLSGRSKPCPRSSRTAAVQPKWAIEFSRLSWHSVPATAKL